VAIRAENVAHNLGLPAVVVTGPAGANGKGAGASTRACAALPPSSVFGRVRVAHGTIRLSGRSRDRSCGAARVTGVRVALAQRAGRRCRYLDDHGKVTPPRNCGAPVFLPMHVTSAAPGQWVRWSLLLHARLPRGRYVAAVIARDGAGRSESPLAADRLRFSVRR
jgi:hypothetical protein